MNTKFVLNIEPYGIDFFSEQNISVFTCKDLSNNQINCISLSYRNDYPELQEVEVQDEVNRI